MRSVEAVRLQSIFSEKWRNFYDVKKFSEDQLRKVATIFYAPSKDFQSYAVEFLKNKNITRDDLFQRWERRYGCLSNDGKNSVKNSVILFTEKLYGCSLQYTFKDPQRSLNGPMYTIVFDCPYDKGCYDISSDIPTVGFGKVRDYRSNNEIPSPSFI